VYNGGGYLTLNFIPSLVTMIAGLLAGGVLRSDRAGPDKVKTLVVWGIGSLVVGVVLHVAGICPIVKRIWTPSWTIFSAGWVVLMLAALYWVVDLKGSKRWTLPFVVVGANSIAMYVLVHVATDYLTQSLRIHFGATTFDVMGAVFAPVLLGSCVLLMFWLILYWMYRNRIFIRL
jgi:predicted acyltransferase